MKRLPLLVFSLAAAVCSAQTKPKAPPPAVTPTPVGRISRIDPTVVEETDTYVIRRLAKDKYIRVDDRHIREPILTKPVEFFKEDDQYYYVSFPKQIPEETELKRQLQPTRVPGAKPAPKSAAPLSHSVTADDFTDLFPPRVSGRVRLEKVAATGLPDQGMWRASFVIADVDGDGVSDIVSPPNRLGDGSLKIWIGDGKGAFSLWPTRFVEDGKPVDRFSIDYGGVAVGDLDGDGHQDVVSASHSAGLVALFGDGKGGFAVVRAGLPKRDFSSQAAVLLDANGDGKLDVVASRDILESKTGEAVDRMQVRVYLFLSREKGFELKKDGIVGGFYSNSLAAWDYDRDGRKDVLTGSHYTGALSLLWRNAGDGTFSPVSFEGIELYAYHFSATPGTFGKARLPAFADGYFAQANVPETLRAGGVSIYVFENGAWTRRRVWRKKDWKAYAYALAMGDLDGDGLDDVVFPDNEALRLRILFQQPDGSFLEAAEAEEPTLDSPGQSVRLADLDRDGRLDLILSETVTSMDPNVPGGWGIYMNRR